MSIKLDPVPTVIFTKPAVEASVILLFALPNVILSVNPAAAPPDIPSVTCALSVAPKTVIPVVTASPELVKSMFPFSVKLVRAVAVQAPIFAVPEPVLLITNVVDAVSVNVLITLLPAPVKLNELKVLSERLLIVTAAAPDSVLLSVKAVAEVVNVPFTVLFAIGRLPGWIAQWKEMRENKEPIGRPRQVYTGHPLRDFKTIDKR